MTRLEEKVTEYERRSQYAAEVPFSERERAELEREIWGLVPTADRKTDGDAQGRSVWLARHIGGTRYDYDIRSNLLSWGSAVDVLWERIEADMTLSTAVDLVRDAKKRRGLEMADAVREVLAEYDARPFESKLPGGKVARKKGLARLPDLGGSPKGSRKRGAAAAGYGVDSIWNRIRGELGAYVAGRLAGLDPRVGEELYRDFERDLNIVLVEYQNKIDRTRAGGARDLKVSRRLVCDACAVLSIDPPPVGKPADLVVARRQQRKFAKLYHPDAHGGDESTRAEYERVVQAYERLDAYNAGLGRRREILGEKLNGVSVVEKADQVSQENEEDDHGGRGESGAV